MRHGTGIGFVDEVTQDAATGIQILRFPGLRRKAFERSLKLLVPRKRFGKHR